MKGETPSVESAVDAIKRGISQIGVHPGKTLDDVLDADLLGTTAEIALLRLAEHLGTTSEDMIETIRDFNSAVHAVTVTTDAVYRPKLARAAAALRPFADAPAHGEYGGPLVIATLMYEDESTVRAGKFAQIPREAFDRARAYFAEGEPAPPPPEEKS